MVRGGNEVLQALYHRAMHKSRMGRIEGLFLHILSCVLLHRKGTIVCHSRLWSISCKHTATTSGVAIQPMDDSYQRQKPADVKDSKPETTAGDGA